jgi:uncharacterized protein
VEIALLFLFAFLAGLVDSIAGGGGLIQLPALLLLLPSGSGAQVVLALGTNKLASICGTSAAAYTYARRIPIQWPMVLPAGFAACAASLGGAYTATVIPTQIFRPLIVLALLAVGLFTALQPNLGQIHAPKLKHGTQILIGVLVGSVIGFYDGLVGPGTGTFLIITFIGIFGFDFLISSAHAKFINVATNISAVALFAATGHIMYQIAIPMALCNILGSLVGTRLAFLKGNRFIRSIFLLVIAGLILKLGFDVLTARAK